MKSGISRRQLLKSGSLSMLGGAAACWAADLSETGRGVSAAAAAMHLDAAVTRGEFLGSLVERIGLGVSPRNVYPIRKLVDGAAATVTGALDDRESKRENLTAPGGHVCVRRAIGGEGRAF